MIENKDSEDSKESIKNEVIIKNSEFENPVNDKMLKSIKSICKITYGDKVGTGFLIKLEKKNKPFYCLMSNEHVLTKEMIYSKEKKKIKVSYDNESKNIEIILDDKERFIKDYTYIDIDAVVVEILEKDKIREDYFLLPNKKYINKYNELKNKDINILQFPGG